MLIKNIIGREILDSRGHPTVEAEIFLEDGFRARASVPSGASTGSKEAVELRDKDPKRYNGKGVLKSVNFINTEIRDVLLGLSVLEQRRIDERLIAMDGTPNKGKIGANTILAISLAVAKAAAMNRHLALHDYLNQGQKMMMPVPLMNVLNGGVHASNNLDIQEFMIVPVGAPNFSEALRYGVEIFHALKGVLKARGLSTSVGDEGGFAPNFPSNEAVLDTLVQAIAHTGLQPGREVYLAMDIAATELYKEDRYQLAFEQRSLKNEQFALYLKKMVDTYPIISIEDAMAENDWEGWKILTELLGSQIQLVGDDLFVTNSVLLEEGLKQGVANSILIKPNQIGTLTETMQTISLASQSKMNAIISHRSGETEESIIADLAVATGAGQIKTGAPCRTDRVAKYNQLLRIEEAGHYPYAGFGVYEHFNQIQKNQ
jgi:enolase